MTTIEAYKNALGYINDLTTIGNHIDSVIKAESNSEFENGVRKLAKKLSVVKISGEYYDNEDYTEKFLIVETGLHFIDFPEIDTKIGYDYAFTKGAKLSGCASYVSYKEKCYTPKEAKKLFEEYVKGADNE